MKFNIRILTILSVLAMTLVLMGSVCATELDADDAQAMSQSDNDGIASVENDLNVLSSNDENDYSDLRSEMDSFSDVNLASDNQDYLSEGKSGNYNDLRIEIENGSGNISLEKKEYRYEGNVNTIKITTPCVINGNGAVIDMAGSNIRTLEVSASDVTIKNLTIKNANCNVNGAAIYFSGSGTVENCNFINNYAVDKGGAIYFGSSGTVENCNFDHNVANNYGMGGAIHFNGFGSVENCNFNHGFANTAGAIYFGSSSSVENCNFTNNVALTCGGVYFSRYGEVTNCNFINNRADYSGGAIEIYNNGNVTNCYFDNNSAISGGAISYRNGGVTNCKFIGNTATKDGGAIRIGNTGYLTNCYFANNHAAEGGAISCAAKEPVSVDTCIYKTDSDTTSNTLNLPPKLNVDDFTTIYGSGKKLTFDLKTNSSIPIYDGNLSISVYFEDTQMLVRNYNCLSGEGWTVDLPVGNYHAFIDTEYAEFEPIYITIKIFHYVNITSVTTHNKTVNITAISSGDGVVFLLPNGEIISANYADDGTWWALYTFDDYGEYNITASIRSGLFVVKHGIITINRVDSILTVDDIVFDYGGSGSGSFYFANATGVDGSVVGQPDAQVIVEGNTITVSALDAGTYTLNVTTTGVDNDHNSVTRTSTITVNKVNSTLTVDDIQFNYGSSGSCSFSSTGATGVNANVVGQPNAQVNVKNNTITVSALDAGTYTLNVTTIVDDNHNSVTRTSTITVNKVNSTLTVDYIQFNYGSSGSGSFSSTDATGAYASVVGQPNAQVIVEGNTITVSALDAGTYTLSVTTIVDDNHNSVTRTSTITVNKVNSTLTVDDIQFNYGSSGSCSFSSTGATGAYASVVNQPNAQVNVKNNTITVSALDIGTYTLNVTTIADYNHNSVTRTSTITVNKAKTELVATAVTATFNTNKYLEITLKDTNGNVLSGALITVDLNGAKTYTTDSNGQIKISTKALAAKAYDAKITFNGNATYDKSSKVVKITVNKAANPLKVKAKTAKVKFSKLKKKAQKLKVTKVVKFTKKGQGTLTYKKVKGNKKITINKKTGKVTIKKGLKKGTYKVKMKINAKGNANYKASAFKTVTFKIKIK